ncbi:hypothetical protein LOZ58_005973 [Ophidiomyces ophidiicola]|nr:hypothetical protein LOZ65_005684 [Ophidiomyces ophidiicola]KAI1957051.1 hypothetical protein LOZ58_005973 [Ophidiomyces ophidiicola]
MASSNASTTTQPLPRSEEYNLFKRYASITFVIAAPVLIAVPPRKLDFYTISLASAFLFSANYLTADQTGRSIMDRLGARLQGPHTPSMLKDLPTERAEEVREQLKKAREAARQHEMRQSPLQQADQGPAGGLSDIGKQIWMGGEKEGWREKRIAEERKALEEGKGYGDLILDHIRDAIGVPKDVEHNENSSGNDTKS